VTVTRRNSVLEYRHSHDVVVSLDMPGFLGSDGPLISSEIFGGCGGLALGMAQAGFRHVAVAELDRWCCETLRLNAERGVRHFRDWRILEKDVREIRWDGFGPVDVLAGGVPCQPFSLGGRHGAHLDARDMFPEFARAVREIRPKAFLAENVRGLVRPAFSDYFRYVRMSLSRPSVQEDGAGWRRHLERLESVHDPEYLVSHSVLDAVDYGEAQRRERVFVVGIRADLGRERWEPPPSTHGPGLLPWRTAWDAVGNLPMPGRGRDPLHAFRGGARLYAGHSGSSVGAPAKTLKAGVHGVPGGENILVFPDGSYRYLTVREMARLQGFPDEFVLAGPWSEQVRQLGNAVPVGLAEVVARSVAKAIGEGD
jgi:DNA (cytosine-5)-methyltransferase 1